MDTTRAPDANLQAPAARGRARTAPVRLGIDVGSTTVKAVLLDSNRLLFSDYRRHNADVRAELGRLLEDIEDAHPGLVVHAAITGSGGLTTARAMGIPFVQEVIAGTEATRRLHPDVDVVIELGGEDAKLTYLHPTPEQRMNGTCAGGTGAFIDQMATLLHTDASGLDDLASRHTQLYPIASRCGVFAKSDIQPLINQGAAHEDLAASIFTAVATQTIAGLACGRPIRGTVMFLGGPLHFLPRLREAYQELLPKADAFVAPDNAQLYVAIGAALLAGSGANGDAAPRPLSDLVDSLVQASIAAESPRMRPLFADDSEKEEFTRRHGRETIPRAGLSDAHGRCWLGIDAGSTTIKAVVIDQSDRIVFTHYASNEGDPVAAAVDIVRRVRTELPADAVIGRSCATGYGEGLVTAALTLDEGEIETMAHYRAAEAIQPGVTSVIDIGGQDMKYLRIKDGAVDSISVNEACSSGCGSFLQTFAETMGTDVRSFARAAMESTSPVDLGTRCTVFMNSSVKQAQKEGADVRDISAGLSYSVVRNALYKVIKLKDPSDLGERVVVQGGTFLNDSVLRAFELLTGRHVVRPDIAGLMGAYGAALTARLHDAGEGESSLARLDALDDFHVDTTRKTCRLCQNHCQMTISTFSNGERHVSGNRCERGASLEKVPKKSDLPNLYDWKYKRIFGYRRLTEAKAHRGDIGIPRVLGMYENYPFWFTMLTELGFRVMISGRSTHQLFESGMESIPSENVCYPAKLVHGHIESLLDKGVTTIFYPCVTYEQKSAGADNHFNCPVVATYPEVIRTNMERLNDPAVTFISPFVNLGNRDYLPAHLVRSFAEHGYDIPLEEMSRALDAAWEEDAAVKQEIRDKGAESLAWMREHGVRGIVLAGRPYHLDPEINHGIPEVVVGLGMAVLTEDSIADGRLERPLRVRDQWSYHSRLYEAAARVGDEPDLEMVQLNSFGCGVDAITADQVQEILEGRGDVHTVLKIDEVSNLGAAKIRLRSLDAAVAERAAQSARIDAARAEDSAASPAPAAPGRSPAGGRGASDAPVLASSVVDAGPGRVDPALAAAAQEEAAARAGHIVPRAVFTRQMREDGYEILAPQMAPIQFRLIVPVLRRAGFNVRLLEHTNRDTMETGLKYVNNDSCYPAIVVIGQLIDEFVAGRADPDRTAVAITQTGGMCRATNYASLLRKGLRDAGYPQVPVIAVSVQGLEDNPGFEMTLPMLHKAIQAIVVGDAIQSMLLRVRPYEAVPGSAMALYERWNAICTEWFETGRSRAYGSRLSYSRLISRCVAEFDALKLRDIPRKPRVGLVGEILVKFHPDANNHAVDVIEAEGCEAELPGLMQFFHNSAATSKWDRENLGIDGRGARMLPAALWAMEQYERPVRRAFARTGGKFEPHRGIMEMAARSQDIARLGNQAGEGWYLTAEMVDMIEHGCPNIICAQPFACLPNHIIGKGMFRALRTRYPQANIVAVDYDPGASEVNQLNRIKLMLSTALEAHAGRGEDPEVLELVGLDLDDEAGPSGGAGGCSGCAGGSVEAGGRGVVGLGMPSLPPRRGAAFRR
ncbi:acyl-CoA dehydratase activase-related protein [Actinomyces sp. B33]|uniref:acyl-CoA dehydratase activase-related protein n=1 Tax=Actinomyces sp. B33 TaxID=2942131 RepID=UPI0023403418|nr:acyl-CoA dehydratase activase-related protein [Actinomyces sp. B33]MDC4233925.1 acyl-CoA dehydratase activase-related protein [Actinomyces sp. B33]